VENFLQFLITEIGKFDAVVPIHSKGKEPLIAMFHKNSLAEIEKMLKSGNFKMHNLFNVINTQLVDAQKWVEKYPKLFRNLNRNYLLLTILQKTLPLFNS
jgi:molybdopterin-guanine dinucleotide biosynthesis protein A